MLTSSVNRPRRFDVLWCAEGLRATPQESVSTSKAVPVCLLNNTKITPYLPKFNMANSYILWQHSASLLPALNDITKCTELLAKQACSSCYIGPEPSVGISVSTILSVHGLHTNRTDCGKSYLAADKLLFLYGLDCSWAHYVLNLARQDLSILIGLLTGHADLNWHL